MTWWIILNEKSELEVWRSAKTAKQRLVGSIEDVSPCHSDIGKVQNSELNRKVASLQGEKEAMTEMMAELGEEKRELQERLVLLQAQLDNMTQWKAPQAEQHPGHEDHQQQGDRGLQKGSWVGVWYSDPVRWYPGEIVQVFKGDKAKVNLIHPAPSEGQYMRPAKKDIAVVLKAFIIATNLNVVECNNGKYEVIEKEIIDKRCRSFTPPCLM
uniref:Uncharacterized protein n=1 Tax=Branchiostoma floridae TaxID=7739 RepID=C3XT93_BRAFL|eukprot:XP_002612817.1 hypothetical protein BRAFLDRAFT_82178 [Branchiostoma floridae]